MPTNSAPRHNAHSSGNSRATVAHIIDTWMKTGGFPDRLIPPQLQHRAFVMEAVYGIIRWRRLLEWVADDYSSQTPTRRAIPYLLTGLYQVLKMDSVADYASVSETVAAAKAALGQRPAGYVNGLLRRVLRERESIATRLAQQPIGIRTSHPDLLLKRWTDHYGEADTEKLCTWNNTRPDVFVRVNELQTTAAALLDQWTGEGIAATLCPANPHAFLSLPKGITIPSLPGYSEGHFYVQDPSTHIAIELLDPQPEERILDACAAPGGKAIASAIRLRGRGEVVAMDIYDDRLETLQHNVDRMKLSNITIVGGDAAKEDVLVAAAGPTGLFDRVLLDVPCSNTGVLRRRPDARWRFSPNRLKALRNTQRRLLTNAARVVAPGGTLVYSTCSLEAEENSEMLTAWLALHPEYTRTCEHHSFPPESGMDGAYAVALQKTP